MLFFSNRLNFGYYASVQVSAARKHHPTAYEIRQIDPRVPCFLSAELLLDPAVQETLQMRLHGFSLFAFVASLVLLALPSVSPASNGFEFDTDRPGSDFSNFNLPRADANQCRKACRDNPRCKAWTYVKPNTIQGPKPRCWLKHAVPQAHKNSCCISGVMAQSSPPQTGSSVEANVDRPGSDFSDFDLPRSDANLCKRACLDSSRCKAWTYVKPNTIQGPNPRCWLKHAVPPAQPGSCCVSGVKGR